MAWEVGLLKTLTRSLKISSQEIQRTQGHIPLPHNNKPMTSKHCDSHETIMQFFESDFNGL